MSWIYSLGGIFGGVNRPACSGNQYQSQLTYRPEAELSIRYHKLLENNQRVTCAYCRTPRMSMHKECKGCGASEVLK